MRFRNWVVAAMAAATFGFSLTGCDATGTGGSGSATFDKPGDYDCAGGSGDGPNYVDGPIQITGGDRYGLDADGDGVGCE